MRHSLRRMHATNQINEEDIAAIMQEIPSLAAYGFGCFGQYHREYSSELKDELQGSRDQLLGSVDQCFKVCEWLSLVAKSKTINKRRSSYGLKHDVERSYTPYYCSNGAFIVAAIHLGFDWIRSGSVAYFNFDQTSLNRLLVTNK